MVKYGNIWKWILVNLLDDEHSDSKSFYSLDFIRNIHSYFAYNKISACFNKIRKSRFIHIPLYIYQFKYLKLCF